MLRILIIDNNDSFVYNLVQIVREQECIQYDVKGINEIEFESLNKYSHILLSPGPGLPDEYENLIKIIKLCANTHSILGVCLGCQAIAMANGMKLRNLDEPMHGHQSEITLLGGQDTIFKNIPNKIKVGRYHSWVVDSEIVSDKISILARDEENNIMAISHKELPIFGLQFHPESYISEYGSNIIANWLIQ